ncbi:MAG: Heme d1 biosynthesis protein [uncultured bacterium (gcode 4)]|uniref:Heme d1 biosynthesis protein n=1 Tax=uncultured bacterium (gcode 4) TaxID=1234023 RepID=K2F6W2_9BACT|nr:MAG: Heme d1 biosynthesis protein [uncultured bacterium (gcode 4)]
MARIISRKYTCQIQLWQDCNLNCSHCWRDAKYDNVKLNTDYLVNDLEKFISHIIKIKKIVKKWFFRIQLTWWEVFLYFDKIKKIIHLLDKFPEIEIAFLTNWTIITDEHIEYLKKYKDRAVFQISIDWLEKAHESFRWNWTFKKSIKNIIRLWEEWFVVWAQSVINSENYKETANLIKLFCELPIRWFSFRKMLDVWRAKDFSDENKENAISRIMYLKYHYAILLKMKDYISFKWKNLSLWCDSVASLYAHPELDYNIWYCHVHHNDVIWIEPNWDVFLCPRLPIKIWNIYQDWLINIHKKRYIKTYKSLFKLNKTCETCDTKQRCVWWDLCEIYNFYWNLDWHKSLICENYDNK